MRGFREGASAQTSNFVLTENQDGTMSSVKINIKETRMKLTKVKHAVMTSLRSFATARDHESEFVNIGKLRNFKDIVTATALENLGLENNRSDNWLSVKLYNLKLKGIVTQDNDGSYVIDMTTPIKVGRARRKNKQKPITISSQDATPISIRIKKDIEIGLRMIEETEKEMQILEINWKDLETKIREEKIIIERLQKLLD